MIEISGPGSSVTTEPPKPVPTPSNQEHQDQRAYLSLSLMKKSSRGQPKSQATLRAPRQEVEAGAASGPGKGGREETASRCFTPSGIAPSPPLPSMTASTGALYLQMSFSARSLL